MLRPLMVTFVLMASGCQVILGIDEPVLEPDAGVALSSLALSAPIELDFSPGKQAYEVSVSLLMQQTTVTPAADNEKATIAVNGMTVESGTTSPPIPLALGANDIEITVALGEKEATYTVTVDRGAAVIDQVAYGKASNTDPLDAFGTAVAICGDTLVVGATREASAATGINGNEADNGAELAGAVFVFVRNGTAWAQQAYIKASNTGSEDVFGATVAIDGDTLAVGARGEDSAGTGINSDQQGDNSIEVAGAVYVFVREGTTWTQQAYIKASNTGSDFFGHAVSLSGDTLAVAAVLEASGDTGVDANQSDDTAQRAGAVYVFRRGQDQRWSQEAYIKASNTDAFDLFGNSIALFGDTLAVGASEEDSAATTVGGDQGDNSAVESGAVYVFRRQGNLWRQEAYLKGSGTGTDSTFGTSVALFGDSLAVGAPTEDDAAGSVYVFERDEGEWSETVALKASNGEANDQFGRSVALHGDVLVVGAPEERSVSVGVDGEQSNNGAEFSGAAYVFGRDGNTWSQRAYVKASNTDPQDYFGIHVALSGDVLAIGALGEGSSATGVGGDEGDNSAIGAGAVYIFR